MSEILTIPVLPLRDTVLFPGVPVPIRAGRPSTLRAIQAAVESEGPDSRLLFAVAQRENVDRATPEALFTIGTVARIGQIQQGTGTVQLLLEGEQRGIALRISARDEHMEAMVREAEEMPPTEPKDAAFLGLVREVRERAAELGGAARFPKEIVLQILKGIEEPGRLADVVASHMEMETSERQGLLETLSVEERLRRVLVLVQRHIGILEAQEDIKSKVQQELGDRQREMVLREQLKAIREELGETDDAEDVDQLREQLDALELPDEARSEIDRELGRLGRMNRESMEYQVVRSYLETVAELPWNERSDEHLDLKEAARILEEDHYGLQDVKDRVLEFLAVRQLRAADEAMRGGPAANVEAVEVAETAEINEVAQAVEASEGDEIEAEDGTENAATEAGDGATASAGDAGATPPVHGNVDDRGGSAPILLFTGPPGVGKTSIAKSIARAMGREYVRIALGGARDEADIRGHRRTYVGAMPGRILKGMKQAGTKNPVFLLDEVDKLGASYQGDPAAALLEVLDPAQNNGFVDHYLGVPFDLSEVMFIATANFVQNIPSPLLDRMEKVEFTGYTEREKLEIAKRYLVPRQVEENALAGGPGDGKEESGLSGLSGLRIALRDEALSEVITRYTHEAGVRQLEREIGRLCRKVARRIAAGEAERVEVAGEDVRELLGRPKIQPERAARADQVGVATGMFYTPVGGDILFVEVSTMRGKGELVLTGQLGNVMKESARAAWSYARSHAAELGIGDDQFDRDVHIHVPAGAIPKDGPSAGVTMASALVSALCGRPVRHDLAMTGEITLSGKVLPIGGVKEKVLGAVRAGIAEVILPNENVPDLEDIPEEVRSGIEVHPVEELGEVLRLAMRSEPRAPMASAGASEAADLSNELKH